MIRWLRALVAIADTRDRMNRLETPPAIEAPPAEPLTPASPAAESEAASLAEESEPVSAIEEVEPAEEPEPVEPPLDLDGIRAELGTLRARLVALSGDTDEDDLVHNSLAELYQNLVTQQLREVARLRWARIRADRPATDGPAAQARLVRELLRLTVTGSADEQDLTDWLTADGDEVSGPERRAIEGACGQARRLTTGLAGTGKPAAFVEDVPRGKPLTEGTGRPWASCSPQGRVLFVVAPAYVVRGRVLAEPLVFTEQEEDDD
ncbi:hypothetical protein [Actinoplanes sp. HUAS TT8]|uniref:hypothetical protein n=1 Tax=Actinoplanes sp. HUAS TT8 TaxID=3447453 RepID=UPI003F521C69